MPDSISTFFSGMMVGVALLTFLLIGEEWTAPDVHTSRGEQGPYASCDDEYIFPSGTQEYEVTYILGEVDRKCERGTAKDPNGNWYKDPDGACHMRQQLAPDVVQDIWRKYCKENKE